MSRISVIVPVYNTNKYLKKCLDSIIRQTLNDIEIVCVNDGSEDASFEILKEYEKKDSRIRVINKENGGLVSARKAGVRAATGEYIGFVDSDDWVESDIFERLYGIACEYNVDMVSSGYIMEGGYMSYEYDSLQEGLYEEYGKQSWLEKIIFNMSERDLGIRGSLCCKLFRSNIMKRVQKKIPNDITYAEDKMCVLTFALECRSIYIVKKAWYHYIINTESMTRKPNTDYLVKVNAVYQYLASLYTHKYFTDNMRMQAELYITQLLLKGINSRMGFSVKNLMWITSDWSRSLKHDSRILVLGKGELAKTYVRQIDNKKDLSVAGVIEDIKEIDNKIYDYVLIAYKDKKVSNRIKEQLIHMGISPERIIWDEQKEIFWKYAEEAGLCKDNDT